MYQHKVIVAQVTVMHPYLNNIIFGSLVASSSISISKLPFISPFVGRKGEITKSVSIPQIFSKVISGIRKRLEKSINTILVH